MICQSEIFEVSVKCLVFRKGDEECDATLVKCLSHL